jgi:hypothetical protein
MVNGRPWRVRAQNAESRAEVAEWQTQRTQKSVLPQTAEHFQDVTEPARDESDLSATVPTRFPDTSDPVEGALADGVRAIADAMRRANADALPELVERMAILVAELKARRAARPAGRNHLLSR